MKSIKKNDKVKKRKESVNGIEEATVSRMQSVERSEEGWGWQGMDSIGCVRGWSQKKRNINVKMRKESVYGIEDATVSGMQTVERSEDWGWQGMYGITCIRDLIKERINVKL